jgi:hypothetical protein
MYLLHVTYPSGTRETLRFESRFCGAYTSSSSRRTT